MHPGGRTDLGTRSCGESLAEVGLPEELADVAATDAYDPQLRGVADAAAIELVGSDVGTPVVAIDGVGFFGPVVTPAQGDDALRLFDGLSLVTRGPGLLRAQARPQHAGPILS